MWYVYCIRLLLPFMCWAEWTMATTTTNTLTASVKKPPSSGNIIGSVSKAFYILAVSFMSHQFPNIIYVYNQRSLPRSLSLFLSATIIVTLPIPPKHPNNAFGIYVSPNLNCIFIVKFISNFLFSCILVCVFTSHFSSFSFISLSNVVAPIRVTFSLGSVSVTQCS